MDFKPRFKPHIKKLEKDIFRLLIFEKYYVSPLFYTNYCDIVYHNCLHFYDIRRIHVI